MSQIDQIHQDFNSLISLQPLVGVLRKMIAEGKPGARKLYEDLLQDIASKPELLKPTDNLAVLRQHSELVEALLSSIFPPSTSANEGLYAISFPFRHETIYASPGFREQFLADGTNVFTLPDKKTTIDINKALLKLAYNVILKKMYQLYVPAIASSVHPFADTETGMTRYYELKLNAQFVDVRVINPSFNLPESFSPQSVLDMEELTTVFPLENFQFQGLVIIEVGDVTQEEVVEEIKNTLLTLNNASDLTFYDKLQVHIETLIELQNIKVGITPFVKMNDFYLYSDAYYNNSVLYKNEDVLSEKENIIKLCIDTFKNNDYPLLYQHLKEEHVQQNKLLQYYYDLGARSLILCPLKCDDRNLIGLLEVMSTEPGTLRFRHLSKMQSVMQL